MLTLYRILAAPVIAAAAILGLRDAFFILVIVSVFTDLVDGPLARYLHQESELGARLDTIADSLTVLAAIFGLFLLERETFQPEAVWIIGFLITYFTAALASFAKFRALPAYHLYTSKAAAFLSGVFFVWLYFAGYSRPFFLAVLGVGIVANLESLLTTFRLKAFRADIASVFGIRQN